MLFTTYGITYFWQNANYIRFDPFFDPGLYDQIRSDPVWSGCSIYKWFRPFQTFFNLITFLNCNFIKVAYRLGQTWTNCKYICFSPKSSQHEFSNWGELFDLTWSELVWFEIGSIALIFSEKLRIGYFAEP